MSADSEQRARAGSALRQLGHALVGHNAAVDLLAEVAGEAERLTERLELGTSRVRGRDSFVDTGDGPVADGAPLTGYDDRPIAGRSSPWGLDLSVHRRGNDVHATVTLREAHEGAPGRSHGGIVAALFDDVFGFVLGVHRQPAFTGELWLRYEAAAPLHRPLQCRARMTARQGRKLHMSGELIDIATDDEPLLVRATATMIAIDVDEGVAGLAGITAELPAPPDEDARLHAPRV